MALDYADPDDIASNLREEYQLRNEGLGEFPCNTIKAPSRTLVAGKSTCGSHCQETENYMAAPDQVTAECPLAASSSSAIRPSGFARSRHLYPGFHRRKCPEPVLAIG